MLRAAAIALLGLIALPGASPASPRPTCLDRTLEHFNPGARITIVDNDGGRTSGKLQFVDQNEKMLYLETTGVPGTGVRGYHLKEVAAIEYQVRHHTPGSSLAGMGWGLAVGSIFSTLLAATDRGDADGRNKVNFGAMLTLSMITGGTIGLVSQVGRGPTWVETRTIACDK